MLAEQRSWVDVWTEWPGEERDEKKWAGVLDEVDCAPGDLWTKVFDVNAGGGRNALGGEEEGCAVFDNGLGLWIDDGKTVVVACASGAGEELLGFFNGGGGGDVEGGWKVADWLLARWEE